MDNLILLGYVVIVMTALEIVIRIRTATRNKREIEEDSKQKVETAKATLQFVPKWVSDFAYELVLFYDVAYCLAVLSFTVLAVQKLRFM